MFGVNEIMRDNLWISQLQNASIKVLCVFKYQACLDCWSIINMKPESWLWCLCESVLSYSGQHPDHAAVRNWQTWVRSMTGSMELYHYWWKFSWKCLEYRADCYVMVVIVLGNTRYWEGFSFLSYCFSLLASASLVSLLFLSMLCRLLMWALTLAVSCVSAWVTAFLSFRSLLTSYLYDEAFVTV